jgi:hypothetical protein
MVELLQSGGEGAEKPGIAVHVSNPSTWETEEEDRDSRQVWVTLWVQVQPGLHSETSCPINRRTSYQDLEDVGWSQLLHNFLHETSPNCCLSLYETFSNCCLFWASVSSSALWTWWIRPERVSKQSYHAPPPHLVTVHGVFLHKERVSRQLKRPAPGIVVPTPGWNDL